jgi:large subunit ribosomal protein L21
MYAVMSDRGRQFRIRPGERLVIDRIEAEVGVELEFPMLVKADGDQIEIGTPILAKPVKAKVLAHGRGPKGIAGIFRRRKDFHRRRGFRHELTTIEITAIG